ncbi:MAG: LapA family protein [Gammaproteobacteria bacterium]|jgi:lipopolysaccharide assembly protein A|nr:LapA family protein [Gammaproteobacteria bacterium]MBT7307492.1 LapA family protein [Gammaproteobacteria bacterium]
MRLITLVLFLIVTALGTLFAVLNAAPVTFNYYLGQGELPLSLLLVVMLASGVLLGILSALPMILSLRIRLRKAQKSTTE